MGWRMIEIVSGSIPIMAIAWLLRRITRTSFTYRSAFWSVCASGLIALVLRGLGTGENGLVQRAANILTAQNIVLVALQTALASVVVIALVEMQKRRE